MAKQLLGVPESQLRRIQRIQPYSTALFMYNYTRKRLYGVFEATAPGGLNLDPTAWRNAMMASRKLATLGKSTSQGSPFPAQVRFQVVHEFPPLPENRFRHIVTYEGGGTHFEAALSADQVSRIMTAFIDQQSATQQRR